MILESEPEIEVVGEAADGLTAVLAARETEPDVILMDVRMPNVDGLEATRRLLEGKEHGPRILILTTFDLDEYVYEALRAGASGFLLKDTPPEQLVEAIQRRRGRRRAPLARRHASRDRRVRAEAAGRRATARAGPRRAHRARARDPAADRARAVERGDRGRGVRQRDDREDPRRADPP